MRVALDHLHCTPAEALDRLSSAEWTEAFAWLGVVEPELRRRASLTPEQRALEDAQREMKRQEAEKLAAQQAGATVAQ